MPKGSRSAQPRRSGPREPHQGRITTRARQTARALPHLTLTRQRWARLRRAVLRDGSEAGLLAGGGALRTRGGACRSRCKRGFAEGLHARHGWQPYLHLRQFVLRLRSGARQRALGWCWEASDPAHTWKTDGATCKARKKGGQVPWRPANLDGALHIAARAHDIVSRSSRAGCGGRAARLA